MTMRLSSRTGAECSTECQEAVAKVCVGFDGGPEVGGSEESRQSRRHRVDTKGHSTVDGYRYTASRPALGRRRIYCVESAAGERGERQGRQSEEGERVCTVKCGLWNPVEKNHMSGQVLRNMKVPTSQRAGHVPAEKTGTDQPGFLALVASPHRSMDFSSQQTDRLGHAQ
ncbi:hypothetical protein DM02DRAFT_622490 [Periconia macrospinosa]|uniref:Uncharacterized protein n=1 Tax=Periconia macrospinosa TaxID=97972 RepID=A0A2V1E9T5_9PLEO|nr:hypothetical protein DM02DRAFT_622490 [Periconia macrospinosa]